MSRIDKVLHEAQYDEPPDVMALIRKYLDTVMKGNQFFLPVRKVEWYSSGPDHNGEGRRFQYRAFGKLDKYPTDIHVIVGPKGITIEGTSTKGEKLKPIKMR